MNNKIKKKLISEFDKYNINKNIIKKNQFDFENKQIVYIKDDIKYDFIKIDNDKGMRLKRNKSRKFRLQLINTNSKPYNGMFYEQIGAAKKWKKGYINDHKEKITEIKEYLSNKISDEISDKPRNTKFTDTNTDSKKFVTYFLLPALKSTVRCTFITNLECV